MECPYLAAGGMSRVCKASVTLIEPGVDEADKYCTTEEHYRCPMLLAHILRGGRGSGAGLMSLN